MVLIMYHERNIKRFSVTGRGDYMSTSDFIIQYYTNLDACRKFFFDINLILNSILATIARNVAEPTTIL